MNISQQALERLGIRFVRESSGISEFVLTNNGLKILLLEHHLTPVVTTLMMYRVGSRNEGVGHTGATHFLEHMMFKSTLRFDYAKGNGLTDVLKPTGADYNAYTTADYTSYNTCLPKEHLGLALTIDADRMRNLKFVEAERNSEMTVVRNEFEINENDLDDVMSKNLSTIAYAQHPYHHPVIGWRSDVEGVPVQKLKEFYDRFYWPDNATLIIVGDFEPEHALTLVEREFGKISKAPQPIPTVYTEEPQQEGARTFELKRAGMEYAKLVIGYRTPAASHADHYVLAVISSILGGDSRQSSRLYKALMDTKLTSACGTSAFQMRDPELFTFTASCEVKDLKAVEKTILAEIDRLKKRPVGQRELARVKRANRNRSASYRDDPLEFADQICQAEAVHDWTWLTTYDDNFDAVTQADIMRVARKYFTEQSGTTGRCLPLKKQRRAAGPDIVAQAATTNNTTAPQALEVPRQMELAVSQPNNGEVKPFAVAKNVVRLKLANGLKLLILPQPGSGVVSVSGKLKAGTYYAPPKNSMIPELTAKMLMSGSWGYTKHKIGEVLEDIGTHLDFETGDFGVNFDSTFVSHEIENYLRLVANLLQEPRFTKAGLNLCKEESGAELRESASDASVMAEIKLVQSLYRVGHPYYHRTMHALHNEIGKTKLSEIRKFHEQHYSPKSMVLAIVGDVDVEQVKTLVEAMFGSWSGHRAEPIEIPAVEAPEAARLVKVKVPGKTSVDILIGLPASLKVSDADFFAAKLANAALGEDTLSSRLGVVVRKQHGLTYGITSRFENASFGHSPWMIQLSVNPANVEKALALIDGIISHYRQNGITEKELADEKGCSYGQFRVALRTSAAIASTLAMVEFSGGSLKSLDRHWHALNRVTREQANEAIVKYFRLDKAVTVIVGSI